MSTNVGFSGIRSLLKIGLTKINTLKTNEAMEDALRQIK